MWNSLSAASLSTGMNVGVYSVQVTENLVLLFVSRTLTYFRFIINGSSASFSSRAGGKSAYAPVLTGWFEEGPSWSGLRHTVRNQEHHMWWELQVAHFLLTYCRHCFCHVFVIPRFQTILLLALPDVYKKQRVKIYVYWKECHSAQFQIMCYLSLIRISELLLL